MHIYTHMHIHIHTHTYREPNINDKPEQCSQKNSQKDSSQKKLMNRNVIDQEGRRGKWWPISTWMLTLVAKNLWRFCREKENPAQQWGYIAVNSKRKIINVLHTIKWPENKLLSRSQRLSYSIIHAIECWETWSHPRRTNGVTTS